MGKGDVSRLTERGDVSRQNTSLLAAASMTVVSNAYRQRWRRRVLLWRQTGLTLRRNKRGWRAKHLLRQHIKLT